MDTSQSTSDFNNSVAQVMKSLPSAIQEFIRQERYTAVAKNLMTKYGLHIDQATILERELMLLLMGIENPDEFAAALRDEARLPQEIITGIAKDINEQIFIPLQKEMQQAASVQPIQQPTRPIPQPAPRINVSVPSYQQLKPVVPATVLAPKSSSSLHDVVQQVTARPVVSAKPDHLLPLGEPETQGAPLPPKMIMPSAMNLAPMPIRPNHLVNLLAPKPAPKVEPPPPTVPYSSDPYREPIE